VYRWAQLGRKRRRDGRKERGKEGKKRACRQGDVEAAGAVNEEEGRRGGGGGGKGRCGLDGRKGEGERGER